MLTSMITLNASGGTLSLTNFTYNLSDRVSGIDERNASNVSTRNTLLTYGYDGTRIQQAVTTSSGTSTTDFTIDTDNPTGYAQTLFESQGSTITTTYLIGQDVVALTNPSIVAGSLPGDANGDGSVDAFDLNIVAAHWQQTGLTGGASVGDFNTDGKVDASDLNYIAANWQGSILTVLLYDGHGNVRLDAGPTGGVGDRFTYDAYGNLLAGTGLTTNLDLAKTRLGYNGAYTIGSGTSYTTGNEYEIYGDRLYATADGRWTSEDTYQADSGDSVNSNEYTYVGANPVNRKDPTGMFWDYISQVVTRAVDATLRGIQAVGLAVARAYTRAAIFGSTTLAAIGNRLATVWNSVSTRVQLFLMNNNSVDLGRKLEFVFGRGGSSPKDVQRSIEMERQLGSIGIFNNQPWREYITQHWTDVWEDSSNVAQIQENGRIVKESLLTGPGGVLKLQTIWDSTGKLIT